MILGSFPSSDTIHTNLKGDLGGGLASEGAMPGAPMCPKPALMVVFNLQRQLGPPTENPSPSSSSSRTWRLRAAPPLPLPLPTHTPRPHTGFLAKPRKIDEEAPVNDPVIYIDRHSADGAQYILVTGSVASLLPPRIINCASACERARAQASSVDSRMPDFTRFFVINLQRCSPPPPPPLRKNQRDRLGCCSWRHVTGRINCQVING